MLTIGVISDTHGLLRPEAIAALRGVDHILHAGDVGKPEILAQLRALAPLTAIRGNVDKGPWAEALPMTEGIELGGKFCYLIHDRQDLDIDPVAAGFDVVVTGHSHRPLIETIGGVCYLNPGSAGPFRFKLPVTLAYLYLEPDELRTELITLVARS
jgi:uncharacterized protein